MTFDQCGTYCYDVSPRNHAISVTMAVSPRFGSQFGAIPKDASSSKKKKKGKKKGKFLASAALSVGTFCWPFWDVGQVYRLSLTSAL